MKIRVAWLHKNLSVALVPAHVDKCHTVSRRPAEHCGNPFSKSQLCWLLLKLREVDDWSPAQDCCPGDKNVVLCCWKDRVGGEFLQGVVLNVLVQTVIFKECASSSSSTTTCSNLSVINLLVKNELIM